MAASSVTSYGRSYLYRLVDLWSFSEGMAVVTSKWTGSQQLTAISPSFNNNQLNLHTANREEEIENQSDESDGKLSDFIKKMMPIQVTGIAIFDSKVWLPPDVGEQITSQQLAAISLYIRNKQLNLHNDNLKVNLHRKSSSRYHRIIYYR